MRSSGAGMNADLIIRFPWPNIKDLGSNGQQGNWWKKVKARKAAREYGHLITLNALRCYRIEAEAAGGYGRFQVPADTPEIEVFVAIHPPDRRRRDIHNFPEVFKPSIDGIQDAIGIDDSRFAVHYPPRFSEPVKDGAIIVTIKHPKG